MQDFELLARRIETVRNVRESAQSTWARSYWALIETQLTRKWKQYRLAGTH